VIEVSDTGAGIEPELLPRIFDAFEQGEASVTRRFGGLGLGLAISRALVRAHGGTLTASSEGKGRGAVFTLQVPTIHDPIHPQTDSAAAGAGPVPQSSPRTAARTTRQLVPASAKALRILLVDDHEDTSRAMARLLEQLGYDVATADSVHAALDASQQRPFDLLISDIGLPDGSGLDLMRQLLHRAGRPIKAVALSGFGMDEDIRKSKDAGFAEHLTKPVSFPQLQEVIHRLTTGT
jgi:two-component system CheB/CheR fusion protein